MKQVGYSGKSLVDKLGFKPGESVHTFNEPTWYKEMLNKLSIKHAALPADWSHIFVSTQKELIDFLMSNPFKKIKKGLWVSWPKKASKVPTDVIEQTLRDLILPLGWVDTKVCAVDDTWSGLKFLRRKT